MWKVLNGSVFKRTSTFLLAASAGTFFFERAFELGTQTFFESINKGKLWKDIRHKYETDE